MPAAGPWPSSLQAVFNLKGINPLFLLTLLNLNDLSRSIYIQNGSFALIIVN